MGLSLDQIVAFFQNCPLTHELALEEREALARVVSIADYGEKKVIFWEGDRQKKIYFVFSGSMVVSKKIRGKIEEVVTRFGPGDFFGEFSLVDDRSRSATVQTEFISTLLILENQKLMEMERVFPQVAAKFYRALLAELVRRLRKTTERLQEAIVWGMEATSLGEKEILE